ncbi:MAG TPA: nitroreductase family protein [Myxococcota bacterium]|nr:nitroreductase family protein [Myxococcota bacterium]HRY97284.1 nitroreductase family protein [Myxococcota bacterium]
MKSATDLEAGVPSVSIRADVCKRDGLCVKLCPVRVFTAASGEVPTVRHLEECCLCGQCVAGCPNGAIVHSVFGPERLRRIEGQSPAGVEALESLLAQRRSVRNYRREPPPRELLERVVRLAGHAPGSPHHRVGWTRSFTIVVGEEAMSEVRAATVDYVRRIHKLVGGLAVRVFSRFDNSAKQALGVAPDLAMRLAEWDAGRDIITYNAPAAIFAHAPVISSLPQVDCDAALLYVILAAEVHGLGTCWNGLLQDAAAGAHLRRFDRLSKLLGIPAGHRCHAAATIGYPALRLHSVPLRDVALAWVEGKPVRP